LFGDNVRTGWSDKRFIEFYMDNAPKGAHALSAMAVDERGATNVSSAVNVVVSNTPPTVALTSPTNGAVFIEGDLIVLSGAAGDVDGTSLVVKFFSDTNLLAQFTNGPYTL
jgi:hypothetical protein